MELPSALREAVDAILDGCAPAELARASERLTARYREEVRDGQMHLEGEGAALAYLAARLPATFAAVREAMERVGEVHPDFAPRTQLDVGTGPGTALWAATARWPSLADLKALDASSAILTFAAMLWSGRPSRAPDGLGSSADPAAAGGEGASSPNSSPARRVEWLRTDVGAGGFERGDKKDLVTAAYVLNELEAEAQGKLVDRLWEATGDTLLIVEPGSPAGWRRLLAARDRLLGAGARVLAPCPHAQACPIAAPDWCHFSRRVSRSRIHLRTKGADVPWEDEKYLYLAVSRCPAGATSQLSVSRILAPPRHGSGRVYMKLCTPEGRLDNRLITKREGEIFKLARRADWGDRLA